MSVNNKPEMPPIAIIGLGALFPGRPGKVGLWRDVFEGADNIDDVPPTSWLIEDYYDPDPNAPDKTYAKRGGFISPVAFDPMEFGIPPTAIPATDTVQLLALIVAKQVLNEACATQFQDIDKSRTSVILGVASTTEQVVQLGSRLQRPVWVKALREAGLPESQVEAICDSIADNYVPWQENSFPGMLGNVVAGRIANRLDLGGTNFVTDAACASSLSALQAGIHELQLGHSDLVISGGVDALNDILMFMCFSKTPAFSPTGDVRPFADTADGTIIGEGVGMLALRRLEDAERDGNAIYAVIRGIGSSSDGQSTSVYAPRPDGQAMALRRAYDMADYDPQTVELVEAHGTGTIAGDAAEFKGLKTVFEDGANGASRWCALGSIKSQIGHTKAAAGAAGLLKVVLALSQKVLPPTIKIERPNEKLGIASSPFYLNTKSRPWVRGTDHPRRASVSSFGFGGSNFHVTVEEYTGSGRVAPKVWAMSSELFLLSSATREDLAAACESQAGTDLTDEGFTGAARRARKTFDRTARERLAIVATSPDDLRAKLARAAMCLAGQDAPSGAIAPLVHHVSGPPESGEVAFLFPGQGSQYVGMGAPLAMAFDDAGGIWDAFASVAGQDGTPLHRIVFPPSAFDKDEEAAQTETLTQTANAQPAIATVSLSYLALMRRLGVEADAAAGHSFGEVTALHAAGVIDAPDAMKIALRRGELMGQAAAGTEGGMLAVMSDRETIADWLVSRGLDLIVANDNGPDQIVLSGPSESIVAAERQLAEDGVKASRLPVQLAFHSPAVAECVGTLASDLDECAFHTPALRIYGNSTAAPYPQDPAQIRRQLANQLAMPVRFREIVGAMYADGVRVFIEVGPGSVLSGLVDACLGDRPHAAVPIDRKGANGVDCFWEALGRLAVLGFDLDLEALCDEFETEPAATPEPARHSFDLLGSNYGRPYPPADGAAGLPPPNAEAPVEDIAGAAGAAPADAAGPTPQGMPVAATDPDQWLAALDAFQRQMSESHRHFQTMMAESHQAYLKAVEGVLSGAGVGSPVDGEASWQMPASVPAIPPATETADATMPPPAMPAPQGMEMPPTPRPAREPTPPVEASTPGAGPAVDPGIDVRAVLLDVVAEKTGYPAEMLELDVELEAGLGIDSIKQVEILSTLRERLPGLPEIDPALLGELRTLGQIIDYLDETTGPGPVESPRPNSAEAIDPRPDVSEVLLAVVAEKTGYPVEMLELDVELEAGLGIDSIKQVEILSTLRERLPGLPEIDPALLGELRTLGQIIEYLAGAEPEAATDAAPRPESEREDAVGSRTTEADDHRPELSTKIERLVPNVVVAPASGFALKGICAAERIAVVPGDGRIAKALIAELTERGFPAEPWIESEPAPAVIHVGDVDSTHAAADAKAFYWQILETAKAVIAHHGDDGFCFVTVQDTGGRFGFDDRAVPNIESSGLPAFVKTVLQEHPAAVGKAIDIDIGRKKAKTIARRIADELLLGGPEIEVGLGQGGVRTTIRTQPISGPDSGTGPLRLADGDVVVVSGGGRGITPAAIRGIADGRGLKLLLLGRTELTPAPESCRGADDLSALMRALAEDAKGQGIEVTPEALRRQAGQVLACREVEATIATLRANGSEARYQAVDITDGSAVEKAVADVRAEWGPVRGLVHAAGVNLDKRIAEKTKEQLDAVYGTKIDGLKSLLAATRDDPLRVLCIFSSIAARYGNAGQSDYAIANEVLNKLARSEARRRGDDCLVRSINWGPWDGGMVDESLKRRFEALGVSVISPEDGSRFLLGELSAKSTNEIEVVAADSQAMRPQDWAIDVFVDGRTHPYLANHVVNGSPVLPVVLVIEWFMRFGRSLFPDLKPTALNDIQVMKGIVLHGFPARESFEIRARPKRSNGVGTIEFELRCAAGELRYKADMVLGHVADEDRIRATHPMAIDTASGPCSMTDVYDGKLFHGPDFQVIRDLEEWSDHGGVGLLDGTVAKGWPGGPWLADPAVLDGGLQLSFLWGMAQTELFYLPTRIEAFVPYGAPSLEGPIRCAFQVRMNGPTGTQSDLVFSTLDGQVVAELRGVDLYGIENSPRISAG